MRNKKTDLIGLGAETLGVMAYLAFLYLLTAVMS